ncbi:30S ribosomal protein S20, partial [Citrobacter sp. AAK_AS5]
MANIKSAVKRAKTSEKSRQRNMQTKGEVKTLRKNLLVAVAEPAA